MDMHWQTVGISLYCDGDMLLLPGYDGECVIKAFYRKKRNKKKVKEILEELQNVVKS